MANEAIASQPTPQSASTEQANRHKWAVLYWMPYDNDLSHFGDSIFQMLGQGTEGQDVVVAIQSDSSGDHTMRRRQIVDGVVTDVELGLDSDALREDSSDSATLADYLTWAKDTLDADHWAVIVVGHGGKMNEISPDDHHWKNRSARVYHPRTWMGVDQFTQVVSQFNQSVQEKLELLFFQNCNKATVEVLYEARNGARYTLASQFALGAPNFYYEGFLRRLGQSAQPVTNGYDAALAIMEAEAPNMYQTLTLVDNQAIAQLPTYLAPLLQVLKDNSTDINMMDLPTYRYFGERHCDLLFLLEQAVEARGRGALAFRRFANFVTSSVIAHYATEGYLYGSGALMRSQPERFCGMGMYCPTKDDPTEQYRSMALSQAVDLDSLYRIIAQSTRRQPLAAASLVGCRTA